MSFRTQGGLAENIGLLSSIEQAPSALQAILNELSLAGFSTTNPTSKDITELENNNLAYIASELSKQLDNPFYKDVKVVISLTLPDKSKKIDQGNAVNFNTIPKVKQCVVGDISNYDIALKFDIDDSGRINIKQEAHPNYLHKFVEKWQKEADERGLNINAEDLRQQVLEDFKNLETTQSFGKRFIQGINSILKNVGSYTEAIQATQKVTTNIWNEGAINESLWNKTQLSEEYQQWPKYMHTAPVVGGAVDGVIDEVVGIPMAVKTVYVIATDSEQRAAFGKIFTKEGFSAMKKGLISEASEIYNIDDKREHFVGQTTITVASMMLPFGAFSKTSKFGKLVSNSTDAVKNAISPKVALLLSSVRKTELKNPKLYKVIKEYLSNLDLSLLDKLADIPGFDRVIIDMAGNFKKFHGGKFVLEYANKLIKEGKILKFEVNSLSNDFKRIYDITYETIAAGASKTVHLELKNWRGFYSDTFSKQFIKDLANMEFLGGHIWIFSKKGINQDLTQLRASVIKALKKNGAPLKELEELFKNQTMKTKFEAIFDVANINNASDFLDALNKPEIFNEIFKIVE